MTYPGVEKEEDVEEEEEEELTVSMRPCLELIEKPDRSQALLDSFVWGLTKNLNYCQILI
jgi:GTP-binding protein Era